MAPSKEGVAARVAQARTAARTSDVEVQSLSAERLAVLKTWPLARLARLESDHDLTETDQTELRNFIANRMRPVGPRNGSRSIGTKRRSPREPAISLRLGTLGAVGILVVIGLSIGLMRTPANYRVLEGEAGFLVGDETRPLERITLKAGTVVRYDPYDIDSRTQPISYWVEGSGYRSVRHYPTQTGG